MRRIKGQAGMSLVEALIILLVLMLLTGVLAPNIFEFVHDGKMVKVKEDCEAIGIEITKLIRDVGPCLKKHSDTPCSQAVGIMISEGRPIDGNDVAGQWYDEGNGTGSWRWSMGDRGYEAWYWRADTLERQLVTNFNAGQIYPTPGDLHTFNFTYPAFGLGWRGAYLSSPIGPDPWGSRYVVNTLFLSHPTSGGDAHANCGQSNDGCGGGGDHRKGGWDEDAFCLSAGPNQLYETAFAVNGGGHGTRLMGDDFTFVISGSSR